MKLRTGAFLGIIVTTFLLTGVSVLADDSAPSSDSMKEVAQTCAKANGIMLPGKGAVQRLGAKDRSTLKACFTQFSQAMQSCSANARIPIPEKDRQPSSLTPDQQSALAECKIEALAALPFPGGASGVITF
jgi:hypothetical protein